MTRITVPSFAKLNLDLRVLQRRPDGYHELRTIFQTISLADTLSIEFEFAKRTQIELASSVEIPQNLVLRAAEAALDQMKIKAWVRFVLTKRIPMGTGLGGGSSNAATVLRALPVLARKPVDPANWVRIAESLGSDVPFFLYGGTAVGLGRGGELYPLPDQPPRPALVVTTGIHVSTAEAYRALCRPLADPLTSVVQSPILGEFQTIAWALHGSRSFRLPFTNDFEPIVFRMHPQLAAVARKLRRLGASPALMTGSGSAVYGIFGTTAEARSAAAKFPPGSAFPVRFVSRKRYESVWRHPNRAATARER
ncbi:MAG: 4-(cytidine 5'-diphospho)-2-C-methyl-D-erythritol kinase [Bryobacteraceae bacterium]